jgi:hypothetical protein
VENNIKIKTMHLTAPGKTSRENRRNSKSLARTLLKMSDMFWMGA